MWWISTISSPRSSTSSPGSRSPRSPLRWAWSEDGEVPTKGYIATPRRTGSSPPAGEGRSSARTKRCTPPSTSSPAGSSPTSLRRKGRSARGRCASLPPAPARKRSTSSCARSFPRCARAGDIATSRSWSPMWKDIRRSSKAHSCARASHSSSTPERCSRSRPRRAFCLPLSPPCAADCAAPTSWKWSKTRSSAARALKGRMRRSALKTTVCATTWITRASRSRSSSERTAKESLRKRSG